MATELERALDECRRLRRHNSILQGRIAALNRRVQRLEELLDSIVYQIGRRLKPMK